MTNLEMFNTILPPLQELIVILLWVTFLRYLVPWLKEIGLFARICTYVMAVEKMANAGAIPKVDKKDTVLHFLRERNIKITPHIEALIEAAVQILDIITMKILRYFLSAVEKDGEPDEEADPEAADTPPLESEVF